MKAKISSNPYGMTKLDLHDFLNSKDISTSHDKALMSKFFRYEEPLKEVLDDKTLPNKIKNNFSSYFKLDLPEIYSLSTSETDLSVKFLLSLHDGHQIETVIIPEKNRITLCVSSQVGCKRACVFCATGRMGLIRNLTSSEIVGQLLVAQRWCLNQKKWQAKIHEKFESYDQKFKVNNIVFMGMGEPLDNLEPVSKAISIFTEPFGLGVGERHVSLSTSGQIDHLYIFMERHPSIPIAISLHAPNDALRSRIMPINKQWPMEDIFKFLKYRERKTKSSVLLQYTLIANVNDSDTHISELAEKFKDYKVKINLIPLNAVSGSNFKPPSEDKVQEIKSKLLSLGIRTMVRFSKGQDIYGACGQLKLN